MALVPVFSFINSRPSGLFCRGQRYLARYTHRCNNGMNVVGVTSCFLVGLRVQCIGRDEYLALENQLVASILKCTEQKKMGSCHLSLKILSPFFGVSTAEALTLTLDKRLQRRSDCCSLPEFAFNFHLENLRQATISFHYCFYKRVDYQITH